MSIDAQPTADRIASWRENLESDRFEDVLSALEEAVATLEAGQLPLATSVEVYEIGGSLANRCSAILNDAKLRVSVIEATSVASVERVDLDPERDDADAPTAPRPTSVLEDEFPF